MRKIFGAMIVLSLLLATRMTCFAAPPPVDGFMGAPWGASRQQVEAAMAEKGFALIEQRADGVVDRYRGVFADHPAELLFRYNKNVFYYGEAHLLDAQGKGLDAALDAYHAMARLLTAKYGPPDRKDYGVVPGPDKKEKIVNGFSEWDNIPTTATPSGHVKISVVGGYIGTHDVRVSYDIGETWTLLKSVKDI